MPRVGLVQMTSTDDVAANLAAVEKWVGEAVARGAELVSLPENFAYLRREGLPVPCAQPADGEFAAFLAGQAREHGIWLLGGTFPEAIPGSARVHNTNLVFDPQGRRVARYRKIHLFDVDLRASGGEAFAESQTVAPGDEVVVVETPFGGIGLSVCYDLRFPELYRRHAQRGARFLSVPAAFARETGKDHWELLLRARAVENQAFVLAPAQCGVHNPQRASYGRSMVVDPWGLVLARAGDRPGVVVADCDLEEQDRVRRDLPVLSHRRI